MNSYIKGKYKSDIFRSPQGYVIGVFKVDETNIEDLDDYIGRTITITGYFYDLDLNSSYTLYGEVVDHPKYGIQFNVSNSEKIKPTDKEGIVEFLSSNLFKGVGEKLAKKIVDTLGENTISLILEDKNNLLNVPKIPLKKVDSIYNTLIEYESSHQTIIHLCDIGFSSSEALLIYNTYRNKTLDVLNENIYDFTNVDEITFNKIDGIRSALDIKSDDPRRVKACILYIMNNLVFGSGDTYLSFDQIYNETLKHLNIGLSESLFASYLDELNNSNKIEIDEYRYYLKELFLAEVSISGRIKDLVKNKPKKYKDLKEHISEFETFNKIKYNSKQKEAIISALTSNITIITGGPGTGKTTIVRAIVSLYQSLNNISYQTLSEEIKLLAPTGRAAKRLSEATNFEAMTIHRFLKWHKESNSFEVNEYNKDQSRIIIVDEASMIDIMLFDSLLKGLTRDIQLVIVGDANQLPSVGPGTVLNDLIESNLVKTIYLDLLYRQSEESFIPILADDVKNGVSDNLLTSSSDYVFLECSRFKIRESIKNIANQLILKGVGLNDFQVLVPMYKTLNGIDILNKDLQGIFNANSTKELKVGEHVYKVGDKVIELVNMPDENTFNGDIGYINDIIFAKESDSKKTEIIVNYDGNLVKYLPKNFNKIRPAYAISIHKSQGSEFDIVIIPVSMEYNRMLYRKLIYTGITRAKKKLILIGELEAFKYSIGNTKEIERKSLLLERLKN